MFELIPFKKRSNDMFSIFDEFERSMFDGFRSVPMPRSGFRTDIKDNGQEIVMEAELPGYEKKDISLELNDGYLTISAKKDEETEDKKDNYIRRERRYGAVSRCFDVSGINEEAISADFKDGVLKITLPKTEVKPKTSKLIEIK